MTSKEEARRAQQPPIPTHPADPAANGDVGKMVGEPALQTPDYNAPPPPGVIKSTGPAIDPGVGGDLGEPPKPAVRPQVQPPGDGAGQAADPVAEKSKDRA